MTRTLPAKAIKSFNRLICPLDTIFRARNAGFTAPPLFILGAPRSGTTLAYQLITQHFRVGYMTAPIAYTFGVANLTARVLKPWLGRPRVGFESEYGRIRGAFAPSEHHHYWEKWFPETRDLGHYTDPRTLDIGTYDDLVADLASLAAILDRPIVFKSLYLSVSAGVLARILPNARFLIIARDPLLVCQSVLRGRERQAARHGWWSVKPPGYRDWLKLPLWQQVARQVFYADAIPRRDLARFASGRVTEVQYTDMCRQPHFWLAQLEEMLMPVGYQTYADARIPEKFQISDRITLPSETVRNILREIADLRRGFDEQEP